MKILDSTINTRRLAHMYTVYCLTKRLKGYCLLSVDAEVAGCRLLVETSCLFELKSKKLHAS